METFVRGWLAAVFLVLLPALAFSQSCPTICVIIPEEDRCIVPRPIPDPACETAVIRAFLSYGFHVVDQNQIRAIRYTQLVTDAVAGQQAALHQLSDRFAADILVLGEAYAEGTQVPGQLRIQAARSMAEVRVVEAATGRILAADRLHTGGVDLGSCELAGKRALERAGAELAPRLAKDISAHIPGCPVHIPLPALPKIGVTQFQCQVSCPRDFLNVLGTAVETALSEQGYRTVQPLASDFVVTGIVTDYKEVSTPAFEIPVLESIWRGVVIWVTVDLQIFDLATAEIKAYEITTNLSGVDAFGIRFKVGPRDIARAVAQEIASRVGWECQGR
jgi:hypothetical protein